MPEPTSTAAATFGVSALAVPALTVFGVGLGLRADVLLAGCCGAVAAIGLLNSVPSTGDTWRELLRTSTKRLGVTLGSALMAGYTAPLLALFNGVPDYMLNAVAFVTGAGAPQLLPWLIDRLKGRASAPPPPPAATGGQP